MCQQNFNTDDVLEITRQAPKFLNLDLTLPQFLPASNDSKNLSEYFSDNHIYVNSNI